MKNPVVGPNSRKPDPIGRAAGLLLLGVFTGSLCTLMVAATIAVSRALLG